MYVYSGFDRDFVAARVEQFRDQANRRLAGELSEDEFKPLRLQNGLYLQLHAYMLRVAIPYGTLSSKQLRVLAAVARRFDRGYGHFTTRQNIQFNWIKLEEAADALALLATADMHAMQTSGNCIRNITADPWAGVAADEIEDPRLWAEILRQWSTVHPEFAFLPRKFKIAVTAAKHDRTAVKFHDIGIRLVKNAAGETGFEIIVGGGMGRTPLIGKTINPFVARRDLLSYLEAVLRVYNRHGRRDNLYKARIKILVHETGVEKLREEVAVEWAAMRDTALELTDAQIADIAGRFRMVQVAARADDGAYRARLDRDAELKRFARYNVAPHRVAGHGIVTISLKPRGGVPGDATADQMDAIATLAERFSHGEIRVHHNQNLILPHVALADVPALHDALVPLGLATANAGLAGDIIACPGLDYCSLANARSIPLAQDLSERLGEPERAAKIGPLQIKISGCINACGHHHVGHIGILGVDKHGSEAYQIQIGGDATENAAIGEILGPAVSADRALTLIDDVLDTYVELREGDETLVDTYRRVGAAPFKARAYAD